jgi:hypothetical protein
MYYLLGKRPGHVADRGFGQASCGLGLSPTENLAKKLKVLSFLPHVAAVGGKVVSLHPSVMDPGFYNGSQDYKLAPTLQGCLAKVMPRPNLRPIKVALVDLTKDPKQPAFAGSRDHKAQVFVASVAKLAVMLAAIQLRADLRFARTMKRGNTLDELFARLRDDWAATQADGAPAPFTRGLTLRGKRVLAFGGLVGIDKVSRSPRLECIFRMLPPGAFPIEFSSTALSAAGFDRLRRIVDEVLMKKEREAKEAAEEEVMAAGNPAARAAAQRKLAEAKRSVEEAKRTTQPNAMKEFDALGFWERLGISTAGAADYAAASVIHDVGYLYIASTLIQSGLFDPARGGGLWLGANYTGGFWSNAPGGGREISATAGSLAAFMTLIAQRRLVSPEASGVMHFIMNKVPTVPFPGYDSFFKGELLRLGGLKKLLSKVGLAGGADECAYVEREVSNGQGGKKLLRYVAVGLRAVRVRHLEELIVELDKCILANNGLRPEHGGHPPP